MAVVAGGEPPRPSGVPGAVPGASSRELTTRALGAGLLIGGLLAVSNVYMGLKTGFWESGALMAALLGFSGVSVLARRDAPYTPLENSATQTVASAVGAMPAAAGLLGTLPALALVGVSVSGWAVVAWGVALGLLGVLMASLLRRRLVVEEALAFPTGVATAELITTLHTAKPDAAARRPRRGRTLVGAGLASMALTWLRDGLGWVPAMVASPGSVAGVPLAALNWGVALSPMLLAIGVMAGLNVGLSMLAGAVVGWGVLAPWLTHGGALSGSGFEDFASWLTWPGVGLLVGAAVASLAAQARDFLRAARDLRTLEGGLPRWAVGVAVGAALAAVILGGALFGLGVPHMLLALALVPPLCAVCARGAGQMDVSPVAQMGSLAQTVFGAVSPGAAGPNIAVGAVVSGAAAQTGVSMWTLKSGHLLGASPRRQLLAQVVGVLAGAAVGVPAYLLLVEAHGVGTSALPAPAAQQFRVVAELAARGLDGLPPHAGLAAGVGFAVGVLLTLAARGRAARWLPSPVAMGLGFILPAAYAVTLCLGAALVAAARKKWPEATEHHGFVLAAGAIAGESIMGLLVAALPMLGRALAFLRSLMRPG